MLFTEIFWEPNADEAKKQSKKIRKQKKERILLEELRAEAEEDIEEKNIPYILKF